MRHLGIRKLKYPAQSMLRRRKYEGSVLHLSRGNGLLPVLVGYFQVIKHSVNYRGLLLTRLG